MKISLNSISMAVYFGGLINRTKIAPGNTERELLQVNGAAFIVFDCIHVQVHSGFIYIHNFITQLFPLHVHLDIFGYFFNYSTFIADLNFLLFVE